MSKKNSHIIANWKMNFVLNDLQTFFGEFNPPKNIQHQVSIAPQFPLLTTIKPYLDKFNFSLAAQNCCFESKGAFTGETSAQVLNSIGVKQVILGHSERRQYFQEDETLLEKKISQALDANLEIIYCVGETLQQRQDGELHATLLKQLKALQAFKTKNLWKNLIVAYEPVWAIGTGQVATLEQVQEVHSFLQHSILQLYPESEAGGSSVAILYGGSVNATNAQSLFDLPSVSGFLVGGASLKPKDFCIILSVQ